MDGTEKLPNVSGIHIELPSRDTLLMHEPKLFAPSYIKFTVKRVRVLCGKASVVFSSKTITISNSISRRL